MRDLLPGDQVFTTDRPIPWSVITVSNRTATIRSGDEERSLPFHDLRMLETDEKLTPSLLLPEWLAIAFAAYLKAHPQGMKYLNLNAAYQQQVRELANRAGEAIAAGFREGDRVLVVEGNRKGAEGIVVAVDERDQTLGVQVSGYFGWWRSAYLMAV